VTYTILDCYTDEPSGLGVPPYLGTYPRYLYGALSSENPHYLTIDDVRLWKFFSSKRRNEERDKKTKVNVHNLTKNYSSTHEIIKHTKELIVVAGIHTPGKYLSAIPGTLYEIKRLIGDLRCRKVLTGPASVLGTRLEGGKRAERTDVSFFDEIENNYLGINEYERISEYAMKGAGIIRQIPWIPIAEIETARGCAHGRCSFCTEPLKHGYEERDTGDIIDEAVALEREGIRHLRLGKQSDFFDLSAEKMERLMVGIREKCHPETLHIDNVNPSLVTEEKVDLVVRYCTPGNVAALGVESFDHEVIRTNNLNATPEVVMRAIRLICRLGSKRGDNGLPFFLPGINLLFGLMGESQKTHAHNMHHLSLILEEGLMLRRINIRQVTVFPGTPLDRECGTKYLAKNRKYYWKWRNEIRQKIDHPMLERVVPKGTLLRNVFAEIYDGNHTFLRQFGTYPLIVCVESRIPLGRIYDISVTGHMLRSITGKVA
jgi:radical SAM superfamily enzyme with C-terminal helix-hairpin-helix motif